MKLNKKIVSLFLIVITLVTSIFLLIPKKASSEGFKALNPDFEITISSSNYTQVQDGKLIYLPSSSANAFDVKISCSGLSYAPDDVEITVRYRTRDITAIAAKGDYNAVDSVITFSKNTSSSRNIRIQVNSSKYQVDSILNVFGFEIYSVTTSSYTTTAKYSGEPILYCGVKGSNKFTTTSHSYAQGNYKVIKEYKDTNDINPAGVDNSGNSKWYTYTMWAYRNLYSTTQYDWENKFCKLGLARVYIGGGTTVDCYDFLHFDDEEIQCDIARNYSFKEGMEGNPSGSFYRMYWETDVEDDTWRIGSGHDSFSTPIKWCSGRYYTYYAELPWDGRATSSISFKFQAWEECRCCWYDCNFKEILIDYDQPYITYFSTYDNVLNGDDTIYVSVKFNEPVVVNGNPILVCALNGSLNGDNRNKINLSYCYGSGTDTICFSYKCKDLLNDSSIAAVKITSLYPIEMKDKNGGRVQIYDMGLNVDNVPNQTFDFRVDGAGANGFKYGNKQKIADGSEVQRVCDVDTLKCPLKVSMDIRTPQITIASYFQNGISQTNSCNLKIENTTENATVYYTFSKSATPFTITNDSNFPSIYEFTKHDGFVGSSSYEVGNLNGEYYMHITVVSKFGRCCNDTVISAQDKGPIRLDNDSPVIHNDKNPGTDSYFIKQNDFKTKVFQFDITDGPEECTSLVNEIYMYYTVDEDSYIEFMREGKINLWVDPNIKPPKPEGEEDEEEEEEPVVPVEPIIEKNYKGFKIKKLYGNGVGASDMITVKKATPNLYNLTLSSSDEMWMLDETEFGTFYFGFLVVDTAGNHIPLKDMNIAPYDFDNRQIFEAKINLNSSYSPIYYNPDSMTYIFNSTGSNECELEKTSDEAGSTTSLLYLKHNGEEIPSSEFSNIVTTTQISTDKVKLTFKPNLCGEYELTFGYDIKITRPFIFYFANSTDKDTYNKVQIDKVGEIVNHVWQLNDPVFYYKNSEAKGEEVVDDVYYGGINKKPTFSSYNMAYSYVRFMELQDLDLYYVSEQAWADALNGGRTTDRLLAKGETHVATVGDYYIRYKKNDWQVGDITPSSWVYYYYSPEGTDDYTVINAQSLPKRLSDAVDNVSKTIASNGGWHFLADNELNKYGINNYIITIFIFKISNIRLAFCFCLASCSFR